MDHGQVLEASSGRRTVLSVPGVLERRMGLGSDRGEVDRVGLRRDEKSRCERVLGIDQAWRDSLNDGNSPSYDQALGNPPGLLDGDVVNSRLWRQAEIPAVNGHGTAHAVARFCAGFADGGSIDGTRLLSPSIVRDATSVHSSGEDVQLGCHIDWGLGFQIETDGFGHGGLGGPLEWGNAEHRLGFGYVTNHMASHDRAMLIFETVAKLIGLEIAQNDTAG